MCIFGIKEPLLPVLILLLLAFCEARTQQKYSVEGRLICGTHPAQRVNVELYDDDAGHEDDMKQGETNSDGYFSLSGQARDVFGSRIDPYLKITHWCGVQHSRQVQRQCLRTWKLKLPKRYIDASAINVGDLVLDVHLGTEDVHDLCVDSSDEQGAR